MNVIEQIEKDRLVPVFFDADPARATAVLEQCYAAGIRSFEFTNRGANAAEVFTILKQKVKESMPGMFLGIGTIWNEEEAEHFINLGAEFVVSPVVNPAVADACARHHIPWMPGCMTPTEVYQAKVSGASVVKIFPGAVMGPAFIKSLKAVFPSMKFMVTGGVTTEHESLKKWFEAGVTAVGIGKELLQKEVRETFGFIQSL